MKTPVIARVLIKFEKLNLIHYLLRPNLKNMTKQGFGFGVTFWPSMEFLQPLSPVKVFLKVQKDNR